MPLLGEIKLFAGNYVPRGYELCAGGEMNTWDNMGLYGVVAPTQGENFMNDSFNLPNIPNVDDCRYIICVSGDYPGPK